MVSVNFLGCEIPAESSGKFHYNRETADISAANISKNLELTQKKHPDGQTALQVKPKYTFSFFFYFGVNCPFKALP